MPSLKEIRKRIGSVKNTQKITKAMKMVAAAKLRRAQEAIINTRPYARRIDGLIKDLSDVMMNEFMHPLMIERDETKRVALLVITSDKGMCGAFNSNIIRKATSTLNETWQNLEVDLSLVGRKAIDSYKRNKVTPAHTFEEVYLKGRSQFEESDAIAETLVKDFTDGKVDEVWVLYNEFKSAISQDVVLEKLVPIVPKKDAETREPKDYIYEPDRKQILEDLVPQHLSIQIYRCLLESQASEHGARMTAMEGATTNAGEMIEKLTMQFNRARQAAITAELMEIISGAEALKG